MSGANYPSFNFANSKCKGSIEILGSQKEAKVNYCFAKDFKLHWSLAQSVETLPGERAAEGPGPIPAESPGPDQQSLVSTEKRWYYCLFESLLSQTVRLSRGSDGHEE